ncbi:Ribonuclease H-like domain [Pseudocohnilembus persalinus]|uniref:Ribonuclease H-like domain n=1 Tax=Pseudocohnilembus persalinus TaxID=266149 RepID=A0A0V0QS70_PSEPJ|nr:Ribonuclease H-like domain [Pseudocohnilembus persalinus]|eukprot:KRX04999.1 Ribonuclease H-like domain [Pseudocohnilembus persalinus]
MEETFESKQEQQIQRYLEKKEQQLNSTLLQEEKYPVPQRQRRCYMPKGQQIKLITNCFQIFYPRDQKFGYVLELECEQIQGADLTLYYGYDYEIIKDQQSNGNFYLQLNSEMVIVDAFQLDQPSLQFGENIEYDEYDAQGWNFKGSFYDVPNREVKWCVVHLNCFDYNTFVKHFYELTVSFQFPLLEPQRFDVGQLREGIYEEIVYPPNTMVIGIHIKAFIDENKDKKQLVTFVSTRNPTFTKFYSQFSFQTYNYKFSVENITDLLQEALEIYKQYNSNQYPENIFIFRTSFLFKDQQGHIFIPYPGTLIENVEFSKVYDFYLISQNSIEGKENPTPTYYKIIYDTTILQETMPCTCAIIVCHQISYIFKLISQ